MFTFKPVVQSSPAQRLKAISGSVLPASVFQTVPFINNWIVNLAILLPAKFVPIMFNFLHTTVGMTNVPGPDAELDVMGSARLVEVIPAIGHPISTTGKIVNILNIG